MRRSDLVQHKEKEKGATTRTSQIVFGERQHLLRVLDSLEGTELPIARMQQERRNLEEFRRLYESRRPYYTKAAVRIDTSGKDVEKVAEEVVQSLGFLKG